MSTDYVVFNQVFKMVVKWSNGSKTVVYRRYSLFFDFLVSGEMKYSVSGHVTGNSTLYVMLHYRY